MGWTYQTRVRTVVPGLLAGRYRHELPGMPRRWRTRPSTPDVPTYNSILRCLRGMVATDGTIVRWTTCNGPGRYPAAALHIPRDGINHPHITEPPPPPTVWIGVGSLVEPPRTCDVDYGTIFVVVTYGTG